MNDIPTITANDDDTGDGVIVVEEPPVTVPTTGTGSSTTSIITTADDGRRWFMERGSLWPGQAMCLQLQQQQESDGKNETTNETENINNDTTTGTNTYANNTGSSIVYHQRSQYQDVMVFQSAQYGMVLVLDGVIQVTERDEYSYQEMMTHIPIMAHVRNTTGSATTTSNSNSNSTGTNSDDTGGLHVLCIGGGDGGIVRELCKYDRTTIATIALCEIDVDVITVSRKYLPSVSNGAYDDPRVTIHIGDGMEFLQSHLNEYDVIITDSSDPVGPANVLFGTPFYQAMYNALRTDGIICTQGECMWLHLDLIQPLITAIQQIYTTVEYAYTTIPTYPCGQIGFILATKQQPPSNNDNGTTTTTGDASAATTALYSCRTPKRNMDPNMAATMKYYTTELHSAAFVLPAFAHRAIYGNEE